MTESNDTNVHVWRSDLDDLDEKAEQIFGTRNVPYRAVIQRLITYYEENNE